MKMKDGSLIEETWENGILLNSIVVKEGRKKT